MNEFTFKGSVMSGGSRCVIAEMLSILGLRESGILDWGNNTVGIQAFIEAVTGSTYMNLLNGGYQYKTDFIDEETKVYPQVQGVEFYHETDEFRLMDEERIFFPKKFANSKILKRALKTSEWFDFQYPMVYLCAKNEDMNGYWWEVYDNLIEQSQNSSILIIHDNKFHEWYKCDEEGNFDIENQNRLLVNFYTLLLTKFPKQSLAVRIDYDVKKYGGKYDNALNQIKLL